MNGERERERERPSYAGVREDSTKRGRREEGRGRTDAVAAVCCDVEFDVGGVASSLHSPPTLLRSTQYTCVLNTHIIA